MAGGGRSRADHCHMVGVRSGYTALGALGRGAVVLCAEQVGGGGCSGRSPRCRLSRPVWTWRRTYRSLGGAASLLRGVRLAFATRGVIGERGSSWIRQRRERAGGQRADQVSPQQSWWRSRQANIGTAFSRYYEAFLD